MNRQRQDNHATFTGDLTPMIDITFLLIAFFMVIINFADLERDERIRLPSSVLAKPPDYAVKDAIVLQLTKAGTVIIGGEDVAFAAVSARLQRERLALLSRNRSPARAQVVIRADSNSPAGDVQQLIRSCRESGFQQFMLRANEDVSNRAAGA